MRIPAKERTREQFGRVASKYRCSADHVDIEDLDLLFGALAPKKGHLALDVATGAGHTAVALARLAVRVVASDLTPRMLLEARSLAAETGSADIAFTAADAEALPFAEAVFDRLTCRIAAHHFHDIRAAMKEIARVLRPGGRIGIIDSIVPGEPSLDAYLNGVEKVRDPSHVRSYRNEEWVEFVAEAGLVPLQIACLWKTHAFPEWVARSGQPPAVQRMVEDMFLSAFPRARETYRIRIEEGRVVSFADEKIVLVAGKPGSSRPAER
ncbi:MAG: methyltransferase domain-containing protein [Deltaproteobacteria bacterium]|nr:methyltransferase domain-containing protein [Deltaproteobacteria bacterium]